jgi:catechol 2,3-dioxygenase-like lactoylglutathione lyase family enzyme
LPTTPSESGPLPDFAYVDHVALTVPDLDPAVDFFCRVLGAVFLYRSASGPMPGGASMARDFGVHPEASLAMAVIRLGPTMNIELFEWHAPDQSLAAPRSSDAGGHHLGLYVRSIEPAAAYLEQVPGVRLLGDVKTSPPGTPIGGSRWIYFLTPWGLQMELIERPSPLPYEGSSQDRLFSIPTD